LALADAGWRVAISARTTSKLTALAAQRPAGQLIPAPLDVTDTTRCQMVIDTVEREHGAVALAVLNAGTYTRDRAHQLDLAAARETFLLNVMGTLNVLAPLAERMTARGHGQLGVVASVAGYRGLPGAIAYGGSKAALIAMTEAMRFDLVPRGVAISVINPGFVRTPLTDKNDFPMPFLLEPDDAARRIVNGLAAGHDEIAFPWPLVAPLKTLALLPPRAFHAILRRATGWDKRP
jgi:short-subunit dehydrogenase